jgi:[protein-PII] uridylyltransferase
VLALHRLSIHAATARSVGSTALTEFDVSPRFGSLPDWQAVRADLRRAYDDTLPLDRMLAERERAYRRDDGSAPAPRVLWLDDASDTATVVEVRAHDSIGLLHRLARALADAGLDVRSARLSTLGAEVVDAFYVVDADGRPLDPAARAAVEARLLTAARPAQ